MPSALILIADGTEEMEFTITYDTLVRAGVSCTTAFVPSPGSRSSQGAVYPPGEGATKTGTGPELAVCSRGLRVLPDEMLDPLRNGPDVHDAIIIPGGAKGAETLSTSTAVQTLVRAYTESGKVVGMICAGSLAALTSGLPRQPITSHPSVKSQLEQRFEYSEEPVVVSGKLVTSRGPGAVNCDVAHVFSVFTTTGTTFPFALTLVEILCGAEKRAEVRAPMVFPQGTPF